MEVIASASASFDSAHSIQGHPSCSGIHGHRWTVTVSVNGDLDPKTGWPRGAAQLWDRLEGIALETHRVDLDQWLPAVVTSPIGLSSYFLERLALEFPRIITVRVECSDGTAGEVRRTNRQL